LRRAGAAGSVTGGRAGRCQTPASVGTPVLQIGIPEGVGPCQGDVRVGGWWFVVVGVLGAARRRCRKLAVDAFAFGFDGQQDDDAEAFAVVRLKGGG
jgi:hypothetical protein